MRIYADPKHAKRIAQIDNEIKNIKQMIDDTYNIDRQIQLSRCLVMLYTVKKQALGLKKYDDSLEELE